jgi:hypothetical protein
LYRVSVSNIFLNPSRFQTLAKAHTIALPADNKLTVLVLLLNTALVHSGQTQRCEEALRIVDSGGCALADLSAIFTAQLLGKYKNAGERVVKRRGLVLCMREALKMHVQQ